MSAQDEVHPQGSQPTPTSLVIVAGNLDIEFENGRLSLFSHDLMKRIHCDAKQTKIILDTLTKLQDTIAQAATAQEAEESTPTPLPTLQNRIDRLFQ